MLTGLASEEDRDGLFIVSFNMVEEVFRKMQLPELIRIPKDYERAITVFNAFLLSSIRDQILSKYGLWKTMVMKSLGLGNLQLD